MNSPTSLSTPPPHSPQLNSTHTMKEDTLEPWTKSSILQTGAIQRAYQSALTTTNLSTHSPHTQPSKFNAPLIPTPQNEMRTSKPQPYHAHLTPQLSLLCPHCLASEHLKLWQPTGNSHPTGHESGFTLSDEDVNCIITIMNILWSKGTRETYSAGLLVYHVFCGMCQLPKAQCTPVASPLILAFIASLAGSYSGSTLANYVYSVWAWHILHSMQWVMNNLQLKVALTGATNIAPATLKQPKQSPITVQLLTQLLEHLNPDTPVDATICSAITTIFYMAMCSGEFTIPSLTAFSSTYI